ncbi:MAG: hypothetical protein ACO3JH_01570 [Flavobacteriaceae bacterium]
MLPQIIVASICCLLTFYGVFKKNRIFFNLGYFIFGLVVVFSELGFFAQNQQSIHLATAFLWMIQSSLTLPNKIPYDGSKLAKSAAIKIYVCLALINVFGVYIVRVTDVPNVAQYFHILLAVLPLVGMYLILNNKVEITSR